MAQLNRLNAGRGLRFNDPNAQWTIEKSYRNRRLSAIMDDIKFTLTLDQFEMLLQANQCPCCGCLFARLGSKSPSSISLDKLFPSDGYTIENVRVICRRCNSMKGNKSLQVLLDLYQSKGDKRNLAIAMWLYHEYYKLGMW